MIMLVIKLIIMIMIMIIMIIITIRITISIIMSAKIIVPPATLARRACRRSLAGFGARARAPRYGMEPQSPALRAT